MVEEWKSLAEVGLDGKLLARHKLNLAPEEFIGCLRAAAGADGRRYVVAFFWLQQRCHVLDENWNTVADYPQDALQNPHSGITDVQLGDLDGNGRLRMFVSYAGVVGVQGVTLDGKRLWSNRATANVSSLAVGGPAADGRRELFCANGGESLVALDAQGKPGGRSPRRAANGSAASPPPIFAATASRCGAAWPRRRWATTWPSASRSRARNFGSTRCPKGCRRSRSSRSSPAGSPAKAPASGYCPAPTARSTSSRPTAS